MIFNYFGQDIWSPINLGYFDVNPEASIEVVFLIAPLFYTMVCLREIKLSCVVGYEVWLSNKKKIYMSTINNVSIVYSEDFSRKLREEIGEWEQILSSDKIRTARGLHKYTYRLKVGDKVFDVVIDETDRDRHLTFINEVDLVGEKAKKKAYYFQVKSLADEAGVPWKVASLLINKDADRTANIAALKKARSVRETELSKSTQHELRCGIARRKWAIQALLGEEAYNLFDVYGQVRSQRLADFLLGE